MKKNLKKDWKQQFSNKTLTKQQSNKIKGGEIKEGMQSALDVD